MVAGHSYEVTKSFVYGGAMDTKTFSGIQKTWQLSEAAATMPGSKITIKISALKNASFMDQRWGTVMMPQNSPTQCVIVFHQMNIEQRCAQER